jgi:2'-5' RNA ligase superfamily
MSLTAIDVLLEPDATMVGRATEANGLLREKFPSGFELGDDHAAHITVVQCFVRTDDLGAVGDAVDSVFELAQLDSLELEANGLYYLPWENLGVAGITITRTPQLIDLQQAIIDALAPFTESGGDRESFVGAPESPTIAATAEYVDSFVGAATGSSYNPHVTIGVALATDVDAMIAEPFDAFTFRAASGAIYQLGDLGTAQRLLWSSTEALPR